MGDNAGALTSPESHLRCERKTILDSDRISVPPKNKFVQSRPEFYSFSTGMGFQRYHARLQDAKAFPSTLTTLNTLRKRGFIQIEPQETVPPKNAHRPSVFRGPLD